jgi:hypothetical protein
MAAGGQQEAEAKENELDGSFCEVLLKRVVVELVITHARDSSTGMNRPMARFMLGLKKKDRIDSPRGSRSCGASNRRLMGDLQVWP